MWDELQRRHQRMLARLWRRVHALKSAREASTGNSARPLTIIDNEEHLFGRRPAKTRSVDYEAIKPLRSIFDAELLKDETQQQDKTCADTSSLIGDAVWVESIAISMLEMIMRRYDYHDGRHKGKLLNDVNNRPISYTHTTVHYWP